MRKGFLYLGAALMVLGLLNGCTSNIAPIHPTFVPPTPQDDLCFAGPNYAKMQIFKVHPDGTGLTALTPTSWEVFHPSWSPDKSKIAFGCPTGLPENGNIYVMNADGTNVKALSTVGGYNPAWSPDGTKIAFISFSFQLWVINADGTDEHQINAAVTGVGPMQLAWSPDSQKLAFLAPGGTMIMKLDGTIVNVNPVFMDQMDWSPDGTQLVYSRYTGMVGTINYGQVFKSNVDGTGEIQLTFPPGVHAGPCWSKDGKKIVFTLVDDTLTTPNMYTMNADGTNIQPLPNASIHYCYQPCWH